MGRNIERAMLAVTVEYCRSRGLHDLTATYIPTAKNKPCLDFWLTSGFTFDSATQSFRWTLDKPYPFPRGIKLTSLADGQSPPPEWEWAVRSSAEKLQDNGAETSQF